MERKNWFQYLIDMTGRGYIDTCAEHIAAPVDKPRWKAWSDTDLSKVYRFYLLRTLGFEVANHNLQEHVNMIIESKGSKK
ncbi:hypothetical protein GCK32_022410, partial [Trichostrongylus colubriformis]